jgi:hypothetical protein
MLTATYEGSPAQPVSSSILPPLALRRQRGAHPGLPGKASTNEENRLTRLTVPDNAKRESAPRHRR